jgi:alkylation response protein AidB-like acyl-CoA dehydrogenase
MALALSDEHRELAASVAGVLARCDATGDARALLEAEHETVPTWWPQVAGQGWLGIHLDEEHGGSGFSIAELVVIVEQFGRAVAPGPFVATVIVSALLDRCGLAGRTLSGLATGSLVAGVGLGGSVSAAGGTVSGDAGPVLGGGLADVVAVPVGDDVAIVEVADGGVTVTVPANLDPARRAARVQFDAAPCQLLAGARPLFEALARTILAAEAVGVAAACTDAAAAYAGQRSQFGRLIGTFQAVKHHCADMLAATELATAAVWDAARAVPSGGDQLTYAAAVAATLGASAADLCANLNTQVHGGIAMTWEHDAHLYVRRATALQAFLRPDDAAAELAGLTSRGVVRATALELPAAAEPIRQQVRAFIDRVSPLDAGERRAAVVDSGYAVPHWPRPFGRDAGPVEQLVIEQEFGDAKLARPSYGITGWVLLTLIQHATPEQVQRWVPPALHEELIWCQLFSEPEAGSDAAGIRTRAVRAEGGWTISGQKVWTTGAQQARWGLATVRTDPDLPKHAGITTMVIDLHAPGVTVRPLRMTNGNAHFNEVFFDDVFVPDADVVGAINAGWTIARATLANESISIGGDAGAMSVPDVVLAQAYDAHPQRLAGGASRIGRHVAVGQALRLLNLRRVHRAVAGTEPGPEGAVTKLMLSELGHDAAAILRDLAGPDGVFLDGAGALSGQLVLMHRAMSIAGGTSEIKRNQIGERILGLPRDPLIG